jgi:uncharacterized caspase-like protein
MTDTGRKLHAVIVGIDHYQDARISDLGLACADARAFSEHLAQTLPAGEVNIQVLLDEEATLRAVRTTIGEDVARAAQPEDVVLLFFAGHGTPETDDRVDRVSRYLIMHDTDYGNIYATALDLAVDFVRLLERIESRNIVVFMDACFSGRAGGRTFEGPSLRRLREEFRHGLPSLNELELGEGRIVISACDDNELAGERDSLGHGIFSFCLLETLVQDSPPEPTISVTSLYDGVAKRVTSLTGGQQTPIINGRARSLRIPYLRETKT